MPEVYYYYYNGDIRLCVVSVEYMKAFYLLYMQIRLPTAGFHSHQCVQTIETTHCYNNMCLSLVECLLPELMCTGVKQISI